MAATGGSLLHRVRRLLGVPTHAGRAPGWLAGSATLLVVLGLAAGALGTSALRAESAAGGQAIAAESPAPAMARPAPVEDTSAVTATSSAPTGASAAFAQAARTAASQQETADWKGRTTGNVTWSSNGHKLEVSYNGEFEFTDDDADVKRLSPGGTLRIKDGGWLGGHTIDFKADASGSITRRYWDGMSEKPFEPEGRAWLAQALPRLIRQTGLGARARVARILASQGPAGVLQEISRIDGSWAKRVYFTELLRTPLDSGNRASGARAGGEGSRFRLRTGVAAD